MKIQSKYFGEISYEHTEVLHFPQGLFGFDEETSFLLLPFAGSDESLLCLQSLTTPALAFVVMNPFSLTHSYTPQLSEQELKRFDAERSEDLCYYVMCVVRQPVADSTVNLRCPLVIQEETQTGMQVILEQTDYHMRHLLSEFAQQGGEASC